MFEKKDSRVKSAAATNLSFLYYLVSFMFLQLRVDKRGIFMLLNFCLRSWPKERLTRGHAECQWYGVYGGPGHEKFWVRG